MRYATVYQYLCVRNLLSKLGSTVLLLCNQNLADMLHVLCIVPDNTPCKGIELVAELACILADL